MTTDLYSKFPELKKAKLCAAQQNFHLACEIYSELLNDIITKHPEKYPEDNPDICLVYLEYADSLIKASEEYFMSEISLLSNYQKVNVANKNRVEDDLEIAWDLLEIAKSVFLALKWCETRKEEANIVNNNEATKASEAIIPVENKDLTENIYAKDETSNLTKRHNYTQSLSRCYYLLGEILMLNNKFTEAIAEYTNALEELALVYQTPTIRQCECLFKISQCYEFEKKYEDCKKYLGMMVAIYNGCRNELGSEKADELTNDILVKIVEIEERNIEEDNKGVVGIENRLAMDEDMSKDDIVIDINMLKKKKK